MKFFYSIILAVSVFFIARFIAYSFNLDGYAKELAAYITTLPAEKLRAAGLVISGFLGLVTLVAALVFDPWERILNLMSPRPEIGTLPLVPDATYHLIVDRQTGQNSAELHADLLNQSDRLVYISGTVRATINGRDLDAPITIKSFASPKTPIRLVVRMNDLQMVPRPEAFMKYDLKYSFSEAGRARRTSKGIHWQTRSVEVPPNSQGHVERVYRINTTNFDEIEE